MCCGFSLGHASLKRVHAPLPLRQVQVDENFARAKRRGAVVTQRFYFRRHVTPSSLKREDSPTTGDPDAYDELTLREVLLGTSTGYPGLVPLIFAYLELIQCDDETRALVDAYVRFVSGRAGGELQTGATWQRAFVRSHPEYKHDSVVPASVVFDMLRAVQDVAVGRQAAPELLGPHADLRSLHAAAAAIAAPVMGGAAAPASAPASPHSASSALDDSPSPLTSGAAASSKTTAFAAVGAQSDAAAHAASRSRVLGVRMRGRSYAEEIKESSFQAPAIRALLERYALKPDQTFYDVPAFLGADETSTA